MGFPRLKVELDQWIQDFIHLQILLLVILRPILETEMEILQIWKISL